MSIGAQCSGECFNRCTVLRWVFLSEARARILCRRHPVLVSAARKLQREDGRAFALDVTSIVRPETRRLPSTYVTHPLVYLSPLAHPTSLRRNRRPAENFGFNIRDPTAEGGVLISVDGVRVPLDSISEVTPGMKTSPASWCGRWARQFCTVAIVLLSC